MSDFIATGQASSAKSEWTGFMWVYTGVAMNPSGAALEPRSEGLRTLNGGAR